MKKLVAVILLLVSLFTMFACKKEDVTQRLETPSGLRIDDGYLCWNPVEHADKYIVSIDGDEFYSEDYRYSLSGVSDGEHLFRVKATGDGILYSSSDYSVEFIATTYAGNIASSGYYSQFDDLTKQESFLGYGFDVIRSSVFSDKYVKTSFPIFNNEELMNQRLLKVDSKHSYVEEIKSSDMNDFMSQWNAQANVNVSWGKKKVGGSVEVEIAYSGGVERAASKYFHAITIDNQQFYIVLQSDMDTYRDILSDGFSKDLYSDMEPSELFDKYGTHFITSAVMGGRIYSYYLYTSEEEKSYHDISGKVSVDVRYMAGKTEVGVEGGYLQEAKNQNIQIKNTLEVIGGGNYGMMNDSDIGKHYSEWEKSLDNYATLIGIKDTGSLQAIWNLIDPSLDTGTYSWDYDGDGTYETGSRAQQLEAYFFAYGVDCYNSLMETADLPKLVAPTAIENIKVNNSDANENGEYEVYSGIENDITFNIKPTEATGYTKGISIAGECSFASINEKNQLVVNPDAEHNSTFNLVLSAGNIRKQIKVRVIKRYTVNFETNCDDFILSAIPNVIHGRQISEPEIPDRPGYDFLGWYTSYNFEDWSLYKFGEQAITYDITLYAKWEKKAPIINFVSSISSIKIPGDSVDYGKSYNMPDDPVFEGYTFIGWYADENYEDEFNFSVKIIEDITIYVKFEKNPIVEFNSTISEYVTHYESIPYGEVCDEPDVPPLENYVFLGWYADKDYTVEFDFYDLITEDTVIYARFEKNPTVEFKSNVLEYPTYYETVVYDTTCNEPQTPTLNGYTFVGWYADEKYMEEFDFSSSITEDITIYIKWMQNPRVSFKTNVSKLELPSQTVPYNSVLENLDEPTLDGYTFVGWYSDSSYSEKYNFDKAITSNTTIYVKMALNPTVSFISNISNVVISDVSVEYGSMVDKPSLPTVNGYNFIGYYSDGNHSNTFNFSTSITEDTNVYLKWEAKKYSVTFNSNGGNSISSQTVSYGEYAAEPTVSKSGYELIGWYKDSSFTNLFDFSSDKVTDNITLYAKWGRGIIYIYFECNGANAVDARRLEQGSSLGNDMPLPTFEGRNFAGWYKDKTFTSSSKVDANTEFISTTTLYAKWNFNTYTVEYDSNGGSGTMNNSSMTYGTPSNLRSNTFSKTGCTFLGWHTDKNATEIKYKNGESVQNLTSDNGDTVKLYAIWKANTYAVTFNPNGGSVDTTNKNVIYDSAYGALPVPTRSGYDFDGWYNGSTKVTAATVVKTAGAHTLTAKWMAYPYTIVYNANGGSGTMNNSSMTYGTPSNLRSNAFSKIGCTFLGWHTDKNATAIKYKNGESVNNLTATKGGTVTLYAIWQANTYAVTFNPNGGSVDKTNKNVIYDSAYGTLPVPTRSGYGFDGWYNGSTKVTAATVVKTVGAHTLVAKWIAKEYTVTFDANGGSVSKKTETVTYDEAYGSLPIPAKAGYKFEGWLLNGNIVAASTVVKSASNHTLIAKWGDPYTYKIGYVYNGGEKISGGNYPTTYTFDNISNIVNNISDLSYLTYADYNKFIGWYLDSSFNTPLTANAVKNLGGGDITLYAKWDLYTVYNSISSLPWNVSGKVIIDWRNETDTNVTNHTDRIIPESQAGRYNNLDIIGNGSEIIFIGDPEKTYTNFLIHLCYYSEGNNLTIRFVDFNYVTNGVFAISLWEVTGLNLTIDVVGTCSIKSSYASGNIIDLDTVDITFVGAGEMTMTAGNGVDGTSAGESGTDGGTAIIANTVKVNMDNKTGTLRVIGGAGGNGYKGTDSTEQGSTGWKRTKTWQGRAGTGGQGGTGGIGGDGGNGGDAMVGTLYVESGNSYFTGGKGGDGAKGGKGGKGGTGGDNTAWGLKSEDQGTGHGGKGGTGGKGGDAGHGGFNNKLTYSSSNYATLVVSVGENGIVGLGGDGGDGGNPGKANAGTPDGGSYGATGDTGESGVVKT